MNDNSTINLSYNFYPAFENKNYNFKKKTFSPLTVRLFNKKSAIIFSVILILLAFVSYNFSYMKSDIFTSLFYPILGVLLWLVVDILTSFRTKICMVLGIGLTILFVVMGFDKVLLYLPFVVSLIFIGFNIYNTFKYGNGKNSISVGASNLPVADWSNSIKPVFGEAGKQIAGENFGSAGVTGAKGEKVLGAELEKLVKAYPFIRVFHGVRFVPGEDRSDIDHVVVIGDKVFFVDAKNWLFGQYYWNDGVVYRNGGPFKGGEVNMHGARDRWMPILSQMNVSPVLRICMTKTETDRYFYQINNSHNNTGMFLTTKKLLLKELSDVAASTPPVVNRYLVEAFRRELKVKN